MEAVEFVDPAAQAYPAVQLPLQTHGTQMAPEARGAGMALFALCLFLGQAIGVPVAAPIVDRWGAPPVFWAAAIFLPLLALWFAHAIRKRAVSS